MNEEIYQHYPGTQTIAEESTDSKPMEPRPNYVGGLGGLAGTWAGCTTRWNMSKDPTAGATNTTSSRFDDLRVS
jgi:hypothetical protein